MKFNPYLKAIVGVLGAVLAGLQEAFPGAHWVSLVSIAVTPILVYLVPNVPAPVKAAVVPAEPEVQAPAPEPAAPADPQHM